VTFTLLQETDSSVSH